MGEAIGIFAAVVTFFATCGGILFAAPGHFEKRLTKNPGYRRDKVAELRHPAFGRLYLRKLRHALAWLRAIMGQLFRWKGALQGFGFCLALAYVYSSLFLVFGWGFFGASGQIGTLELMPDWQRIWRAVFALGIFVYAVAAFFAVRWGFRRLAGSRAVVAVLLAGAGLGFVADVVAGAGAVVMVAGLAGAVGGTVNAQAESAKAVLFAGTIVGEAVLVSIAIASGLGTGFDEIEFRGLLLWTALPLANAGPDLISWWVSRWLGADLVRGVERTASRFVNLLWTFGHVLADLLAAVGFFVLLAFLMPQAVTVLNGVSAWFGSTAELPLRDPNGYVCQAARQPWGEGAWPMLMLLSTLVPTALHFLMVLWSLMVVAWLRCFRATKLADRLAAVPDDFIGDGTTPAISSAIDDAAWRLTWAWFAATVLGCALLAGGWVVLVEIDHAWLDVALGWLKWLTLWAAYAGDTTAVNACLP